MNQQQSQSSPADPRFSKKKLIADAILIGGILLVAASIALCVLIFRTEGDSVTVLVGGETYGTYALDEDRTVEISSGEGKMNVLVIKNGEAYIESATCPDGSCAAHRPISHDGEQIACVPNEVVIVIRKAADDAPDIVV